MAGKSLRLFRPKDIFLPRDPQQLTCTDDGRHVAFVVSEALLKKSKSVSRLWLLDEDAVEGARQVTFDDENRTEPKFSPDGEQLAYMTRHKKRTQLVVLRSPYSEPKILTGFQHGVSSFRWNPSGKSLLVLAPTDDPQKKRDAEKAGDDSREVDVAERCSTMWLLRAEGGKPKHIGPSSGHVIVADWSPDGKSIAYIIGKHVTLAPLHRKQMLNMLDVRTGRSRLLRRLLGPAASDMTTFGFSPDGSRIIFACGPSKERRSPLCLYTMSVKGGRAVRIDRVTDRTSLSPVWLDNSTILYIQQHQMSTKLRSAPINGKAGTTIVDWPGSVLTFCLARKARKIFFCYSETVRPHQIYSLDLDSADGGKPELLSDLNRPLKQVKLSEGELIKWKAPDGLTIEGWFYRPTTQARAPYATIMMPHGGPQSQIGNDFGRSAAVQPYCAAGYAVFMPNFRGSTGYGEAFTRKILNNWGPGPASDIFAGLKMLVRRKLSDPKRLLIRGGSYGGYMTAWLIGHSDMFRAAVAHAPVVNNISMWGTTDIPGFMDWHLSGTPLERYKKYWQLSPIAHLKGCKTPTLVVSGEEDRRVPPNQAYELYRTLWGVGVATGLVLYPREGHGIEEPKHRLDMLNRTLAWFHKHLGKDAPKAR